MSTSFKRYVLHDAIGLAAVNSIINAGYTAWLWRGRAPLALFDEPGVALDLANTPMVIALLSTLLGTAAARRKLADGRVAAGGVQAPDLLRMLPGGVCARSVVLAALAGLLLAMPIWLVLVASGAGTVPLPAAVSLKVLITAVMTLAIVPVVLLAALSDVQAPALRRLAV